MSRRDCGEEPELCASERLSRPDLRTKCRCSCSWCGRVVRVLACLPVVGRLVVVAGGVRVRRIAVRLYRKLLQYLRHAKQKHGMGAFRCAAACEMQAWLARSKRNAKTSTAAYPTESIRRHRSARSSSSGRTARTRDLPYFAISHTGQPNQTYDSWHSRAPEAERQLPLLPRLHLPSGQFSSGRSRKITSRKAGRTRSHARTFTSEAKTCQTNARGHICDRLSRLRLAEQ